MQFSDWPKEVQAKTTMVKKQTKKEREKEFKKNERRLWKEARQEVLDRDKVCLLCGSKKGDTYLNKKGKVVKVKLDVHHLLEKEFIIFRYLKFDERNLVTLCPKCHKFGEFSIHRNPLYALDVIKKKLPENYEFLLKEVKTLWQRKKLN